MKKSRMLNTLSAWSFLISLIVFVPVESFAYFVQANVQADASNCSQPDTPLFFNYSNTSFGYNS